MNLNKKGFVLTETLMVTVFIVTIFTFIYTSIIPLFGRYRDMAEREQNIDIIYKLYGIRKFIKADKNSIVISQSPLKQITCADLENAYDCNMLLDYLELKDYELYYIRKISDSYNNSLISEEVQDYLKNYITDEKKTLVLLDNKKHTIAHLDYESVNMMNVFPDVILNQKSNISKIYFKKENGIFIKKKYNDAPIKANITYNNMGKVYAWLEDDPNNSGKKILYVESPGKIYLNTGRELFKDFSNVKEINFENIDTSMVTDMNGMFKSCTSLLRLDLRSFDTSNVDNMASMFYGCQLLNSLNISKLITNDVTTMSNMFNNCRTISSLNLNNFDTGKVLDMSSMFENCRNITNLNLTSFDTSLVSNMSKMFFKCLKMNIIDVSSFNTISVVNMSYMFSQDSDTNVLNEIRGLDNLNTSKVETMEGMFWGANIENLSLTTFNTAKLANALGMFKECQKLQTVDLSGFNTSLITNIGEMFYNCSKLETIYVSNSWNVVNASANDNVFYNCTSLVGGNGTIVSSSAISGLYARIDKWTNSGYLTEKGYSFSILTGLASQGEITSERMKYSINNNVITVTALQNDGYGFTTGRVNLEAGKTYVFDCTIDKGTWPSSAEAYLMFEGNSTRYIRMNNNDHFEFVPTISGEYWLRLDVNKSDNTIKFTDIMIREKL